MGTDANAFYTQPILNSSYEKPIRHWELDENQQPTRKILPLRRPADFITPIPKPKGRAAAVQGMLKTDATFAKINNDKQSYHKALLNEVSGHVHEWRESPTHVTSTTAKLLHFWHTHKFNALRPFFCQIEAGEMAIWLTEVTTHYAKFRKYLDHLASTADRNAGLAWLALKMATGSGKTTVMAMLIAWQTLKAVRSRKSAFTNGFLIVTPGITIKDRLQVCKPNYLDTYYQTRELLPPDMLGDMRMAVVVVTNYHAFMLRVKSVCVSTHDFIM